MDGSVFSRKSDDLKQANAISGGTNTECPCKRQGCKRHGDCAACREFHSGRNKPPACQREPKAPRARERSKNR
ncbi:MAG: hypothetical protein PHI27_02265 [Eubacteriales bacterium]|nr:hypothetical protein [Eubacteriales bacterium]MDD3881058.1 hypothetical protein [Eubacteriales bacterium]MDD4511873.1 hypothetical protein [Eubacteriales bacterium]